MAVPLVRKQPRPVSCASAVLLTKQDFEQLRMHALSPSRELPRCIPMSIPVQRSSTPGCGGAGAGPGGILGPLPAPGRRTRSASNKRQPGSFSAPSPNEGSDAPQGVAEPLRGAARGPKGVRAHVAGASGPAGGVVVTGSRSVEPQRTSAESRGPAGFRANAAGGGGNFRGGAVGPVAVGGASAAISAPGLGLELCGFDPRKMPRPPPAAVAVVGVGGAAGAVRPAQGPGSAQPDPLRIVAVPPPSLGLAVSGQAAPVAAVSSETPPPATITDLEPEDWTSSEDEGPDADGEGFDYRKYRYHESQASRTKQAPEPAGLRKRNRRACPPRDSGAAGDSDGEWVVPWSSSVDEGLPPPLHWWSQRVASACSTPLCEEEAPEDEQLQRIADILVRFYGLPGGQRAVRRKSNISNLVIVEEAAWVQRQRQSQLDEPPMIWVRGGRVYDFHGDRGTLAEFEHDLLTRQVEDDSTCRQRRKEQGLMPFPFVALPLRRHCEDQAEEQQHAEGGREGARRGGGHWS